METLFLLAAGLLGAALAPWAVERLPIRLPKGDFWLAFSGAFITTSVLLHLFPEFHFMIKAVPLVVVGFFVQFFIEMWTQGIEHGHAIPSTLLPSSRLWGLWLALLIHSLVEGASLVSATTLSPSMADNMYLSIIIHKIPAAFILYFLLRESRMALTRRWMLFGTFALASPVGLFVGWGLIEHTQLLWIVGAFVVGSFLHIGTSMLAEVGHHHQRGAVSIMAVVLGVLIAWFS